MKKHGFFYLALRGLNDLHRYIFGVIIVILAYFFGQIPLAIALVARDMQDSELELMETYTETQDLSVFGLDKNLMFFLMLMMFVFAMIGLLIVIRWIHKKRLKDLITPNERYDWNKIAFSFAFWIGITMVIEAFNYIMSPGDYTWQFETGKFLLLFIMAVLLIPIQTSFEELFLRGYLMQGLGLAIRNKWLPLLITSFAFGSLHLMNPEVGQYGTGLMLAYYVSAGLIMGLMTIFDDSLELALGAHAAVNLYAALFVTYEGSALDTYALFKTGEIDPAGGLLGFVVIAIIFFVICTRKYGWTPMLSLTEQLNFEKAAEVASPDQLNFTADPSEQEE